MRLTITRAEELLNTLYERDYALIVAKEYAALGHCESLVREAIRKARRANWKLIRIRKETM